MSNIEKEEYGWNARFRNVMFTSYNGLPDCTFKDAREEEPLVTYCIMQLEKCPTTGKEHLQGYIELKKALTRRAFQKKIFGGEKIWCTKRKGTQKQAIDYCSKQQTRIDGPWSHGEPKKQGQRNDIEQMYDMIKNKATDIELQEHDINAYVKFYKAFDRVRYNLLQEESQRFRKVDVTVLLGKGGNGKTRYVFDKYGYKNAVYKLDRSNNNNSIWFDGYIGQDVLFLDDFYGSAMPWGFLLNLLDGYPLRLPVKCSHSYANFTKIYISSNNEPETWYKSKGMPFELKRRLNKGKIYFEDGIASEPIEILVSKPIDTQDI